MHRDVARPAQEHAARAGANGRSARADTGNGIDAARGIVRLAFEVRPAVVLKAILIAIAVLLALGMLSAYLARPYEDTSKLLRLFMMDHEKNVPTLFSFVLLLASAALLTANAARPTRHSRTHRRQWIILIAVFILMAFDEAASVHESLIFPIRQALDTGGPLHFAWVIPGGIFVLAMLVGYLRFLQALPRETAWLLVLAGGMYVGGALCMEMVGGIWAAKSGQHNLAFHALAMAEESLEMLGLAIFVYALLNLLLDCEHEQAR